jgi:hypothetical protein
LDLENPEYRKTSAMKLDLLTNIVVIDDTRKKMNLEREKLLQQIKFLLKKSIQYVPSGSQGLL